MVKLQAHEASYVSCAPANVIFSARRGQLLRANSLTAAHSHSLRHRRGELGAGVRDRLLDHSSPAGSSTLSATIRVSATASDNVGVAGVQFKLDGANLGAEVTTASPYSTSWNRTSASNGSQTLTAIARDAAGKRTKSTTVTMTVANKPDCGCLRILNNAGNPQPVLNVRRNKRQSYVLE